jgi:hypothetical protein
MTSAAEAGSVWMTPRGTLAVAVNLTYNVELAQNLGVQVIEAGWLGYAAQKNWAAERAANDWILSLDDGRGVERSARSRDLEPQEIRPSV